MTTTVVELIAHLKHYSDNTKVIITDVDDTEFAITDFKSENNNIVNIVIGEIAIDEKQEEGE